MDVHTRHCCVHHGCKYSDETCTVTTRKEPQEHPCEHCQYPDDHVVYSHKIAIAIEGLEQLKRTIRYSLDIAQCEVCQELHLDIDLILKKIENANDDMSSV